MTMTDARATIERLLADKPVFHLGGEARWDALPGTLGAIRATVRPGQTTIETGVGASTLVFASCGAVHTAISPDPLEHQRVCDYAHRIGIDTSRITFVEGLSDDVLPATLQRARTLDFAFIDGAHSFPFPEVDWYYISRSLRIGGSILLDDIPIPAVAQVFRHMRMEPNWRLDGIYDNRSAAFTLVAEPAPENWPNQPFNDRYPMYTFASLPKQLELHARHRADVLRKIAARRFPALRGIYRSFR
jgi:hypothetical protein